MEMTYSELLTDIENYNKTSRDWSDRVDKITKLYRDETDSRYNILWSNIQTVIPATLSRIPQPSVKRSFDDKDPAGRVASILLERSLEYETNTFPDYNEGLTKSVLDRFLGGRGIAWVRYEPEFGEMEVPKNPYDVEESDDIQITEDKEYEVVEYIEFDSSPVDYVFWRDFGHDVCRSWEEVTKVWRRVYMDRESVAERFGEELASAIPYSRKKEEEQENEEKEKAEIYEIWCKDTKMVYWLCKGYKELLDKKNDPLKLDRFFPCPKPLYATLTNDSLIPIPDFCYYQTQADELDLTTRRIGALVEALKVRGIYDASQPQLQRILDEGDDNKLFPVENYLEIMDKGGLHSIVQYMSIAEISSALMSLYQTREHAKQTIYEITGLSDIIRGASVAAETATAQSIKSQFASLRLKKTQDDVARFASDLIRIKAEIICKHYQPESFIMISDAKNLPVTDQQFIPQAIQLLRDNVSRQFRIEVSSDSLVILDEQEEKQSRVEFITASTGFLEKAVTAAQAFPALSPLLMEMLMFGVRGFKAGRELEGTFEQVLGQLQGQQQGGQQEQQGDELSKAEQVRAQGVIQKAQMDNQTKIQIEQMKLQNQVQIEQMKASIKAQADSQKAQNDAILRKLENINNIVVANINKEADENVAKIRTGGDIAKESMKTMGNVNSVEVMTNADV